MSLVWSSHAVADLQRLFAFLAPFNRRAAAQKIRTIRSGAVKPRELPRLGERVAEIEARDVRRLFVDDYELRYEVRDGDVYVLRIWHAREDR